MILIVFQSHDNFKMLCIYEDHKTKFCIVALNLKKEQNKWYILLDIFCLCGAIFQLESGKE